MKKKLWLTLRLAVALAGIAYIAWSVTWTDQVLVPASVRVRPDWVLDQPRSFRVLDGAIQRGQPIGPLTLAIPSDHGPPALFRVPADRFASSLSGPQTAPASAPAPLYRFKPGVLRTIRDARPWLLLLGLLVVAPLFALQTIRWWLLMRARRLGVALWPAFRLYMAASFFNYCMPGTTGGDVLKAYYAARDSDRRLDAVMSIVVDRIAGMLGLVLLAGFAGLFMLHNPLARQVTAYLWLGIALLTLAAFLYLSPALRRRLASHHLLPKLPAAGFLARLDAAALAYRTHPAAVAVAVALSVLVHLCLALATAASAYALGAQAPLGLMLTVVPIIFMAGTMPISYQGLGVMEGLAMALLLRPPTFTANHIVGMLLLVRVYPMLYAMSGSLFLIRGDLRMRLNESSPLTPDP